ncbi:MAG: two pore domain potassium channel family protein [Chlorobaculum sp.]|nr:two pore domain potassium channel family protein [Chlorobaculum sp.]
MKDFFFWGMFGWLKRVTPWSYVFFYVIAVLIFAWIFFLIPEDFYHPYAKYEKPMFQEAALLCDRLTVAFRASARKEVVISKLLVIDPSELEVTGIKPDGNDLIMHLRLKVINTDKHNHWEMIQTIPLRMDTKSHIWMPEDRIVTMFSEHEKHDWKLFPVGFPMKNDDVELLRAELPRSLYVITVTENDYKHIRSFLMANTGFPHEIPRGFWRMLHLSLTTITTLGYGDIVPLTDRARLFTGIEATTGVILLGLLISSMVSDRKKVE